MTELHFDAPKQKSSIIKVLGVGGGGSNAVTHMFKQGIKGVDFIICNTDAQAMDTSPIPNKIQLGNRGLGAGSIPDVGREAAEENIEDIRAYLESHTKMLFITAGMGGGTGTGAAPVIAKVAKEMGILTVAIVTIPFYFEGRKRRLQAENGIDELKKHVDTLLLISNEKLREIHGNLKLSEAFGHADDILTTAAKGIAEIITVTGYINVDFEDVKTVMKNSGTAIMGSALAEGPDRAVVAVKEALSSPLLNDNKITGASNILLYIASGKEEITFDEVTEITDYIQNEAGQNAEIIWGNGYDESLDGKISITLIATGFKSPEMVTENTLNREKKKTVYALNDNSTIANAKKPEPELTTPISSYNETEQKSNHSELTEIEFTAVNSSKEEPVAEQADEPVEVEIVLVKKEKPADAQKPEQVPMEVNTEPFLFIRKPVAENITENKTPRLSFDIPITTEHNSNLRIKHTVGEFPKKPERPQPTVRSEDERVMMEKKAEERQKKLRELSLPLNLNESLDEMEKVPAYLRRKVQLNSVTPSSESVVSRYSIGESNEKNDSEIQSRDIPFLHNKPD